MEIHHLDLHLAFHQFYGSSKIDGGKEFIVYFIVLIKKWMDKTDKTKLVRNPAPPAANASCGIVSCSEFDGRVGEEEENDRIPFWKAVYVTKRAAVSAMEPTIGAGSPWTVDLSIDKTHKSPINIITHSI